MKARDRRLLRRATRMPESLEAMRREVLRLRRVVDDEFARVAKLDADLEELEAALEAAAFEWHADGEGQADLEESEDWSPDTGEVEDQRRSA